MTRPPPHAVRRRLATAVLIGVVGYVVVDIVLQALPPHYSPIREAESKLAVGPFGWIMNLNFLGRAVFTFCAIGALGRTGPASPARRAGLLLLGIGGVSSGILAFFPTDVGPTGVSATGVSASAENGLQPVTTAGFVHLAVASLGFLAALAGVCVLTRWLRHSPELAAVRVSALVFAGLAGGGLLGIVVTSTLTPDWLGLAERLCLLGILGWVFVVCLAIRRVGEPGRPEPGGRPDDAVPNSR